MTISNEKRTDIYSVEWEDVESSTGKTFSYATITIHELWSIGHILFPKEPLKIEVFFGDGEDPSVLACYDFGMEDRIPTAKDKNWLYDYTGENKECLPIKTVFSSIKFDLMHAFFHCSEDPNYNHTHWALYGNLKDRVVADDSFQFDDLDNEEKKNSCPFKVGDRIRTRSYTCFTGQPMNIVYGPPATVTAVRNDGFDWKLDEPQTLIAREGSWYQDGTCFPGGYDTYELVPKVHIDMPPARILNEAMGPSKEDLEMLEKLKKELP